MYQDDEEKELADHGFHLSDDDSGDLDEDMPDVGMPPFEDEDGDDPEDRFH